MSEGKDLVRRALGAMASGNVAEFDAVLADEYIQHNDLGPGREPVKAMTQKLRAAFPDLEVVIEDLIAEGDRVVARVAMQGTHQGRFMGVEPTGRPITIRSVDIWRVEGGRLKEHWDLVDRLGFMRQLGLAR